MFGDDCFFFDISSRSLSGADVHWCWFAALAGMVAPCIGSAEARYIYIYFFFLGLADGSDIQGNLIWIYVFLFFWALRVYIVMALQGCHAYWYLQIFG